MMYLVRHGETEFNRQRRLQGRFEFTPHAERGSSGRSDRAPSSHAY